MTTDAYASASGDRRLSPADLQHVQFSRASMLHPGYSDVEVDRFLHRTAEELARLHEEKAQLRDELRALREQVAGVTRPEPPSEQAVRILASAQQTADSYVAEAEDFSRQMTADARSQYEEQVRRARENAGAIIQAAQEAAARLVGSGNQPAAQPREGGGQERSTQELEEQVAYLKAFAQACRVQLRAYLEALLTDVESEWGRADPGSLPLPPLRASAQRAESGGAQGAQPTPNVARELPRDRRSDDERPAAGGSEVVEHRR
jgi:DivIVA domain-containing protein